MSCANNYLTLSVVDVYWYNVENLCALFCPRIKIDSCQDPLIEIREKSENCCPDSWPARSLSQLKDSESWFQLKLVKYTWETLLAGQRWACASCQQPNSPFRAAHIFFLFLSTGSLSAAIQYGPTFSISVFSALFAAYTCLVLLFAAEPNVMEARILCGCTKANVDFHPVHWGTRRDLPSIAWRRKYCRNSKVVA